MSEPFTVGNMAIAAVAMYRVFRSVVGWGYSTLTMDDDQKYWYLRWHAKGYNSWMARISFQEFINDRVPSDYGRLLAERLKWQIKHDKIGDKEGVVDTLTSQ